MKDFQINTSIMGWLSSMYFIANFIFLFPAGILLDRFSSKKLILLAMIFAIVSMFGFAYSKSLILAIIFRFFSGIAGAFCFIGPLRLATRWFSEKKMALIIGSLITVGMLGGIAAQTPVVYLTQAIGWRNMMLLSGFLGLLFIIWIIIFVKDWPKVFEEKEDVKEIKKLGFINRIFLVLKNPYNWLGGLYTALLNLPIFVLGALWGQIYLTQAHKLEKQKASLIISLMFIGSIIGSPLMGWISDKIKKRKLPMILGAILSFFIIIAIIYIPNLNFYSLLSLFFILGFVTSTQVLSYPTITELNTPLIASSANSIISSILIASGFIFQPLFGWMIAGAFKIKEYSIQNYSTQDFYHAMIIFPIACIMGFIVSLFMKETRCKRLKK